MAGPVEFEQIQGIVRFGYRKLTECSYVLLAIEDAAAAREWLGSAPVSNSVEQPDAPETALQVALTHQGLERLGCASRLLEQFSVEFRSGLGGSDARARLLGDVGASAPEHWQWGTGGQAVDVLLMFFARPGKLAAWKSSVQTSTWGEAFRVVAELTTIDLHGVEPFGFPDGLSQPEIDWERRQPPSDTQDTYTNRIALGEFLLGYPNEYNHYTRRPLLPADSKAASLLPAAEEDAAMRDLGRNGSYLVLRTLEQDVTGFWDFVRRQTESEEVAQTLASAMVGRRKDGTPLAALDAPAVPGVDPEDRLNHFGFDGDPEGVRCPLGAHIRRANPRNGDLPAPPETGLRRLLRLLALEPKTLESDAKASSRFHRILRRGREYGSTAPTETGDGAPVRETRGLHFVCLGANIARQFEFLQSAWMMSTKFDAMTDESDPLLGSREAIPGAGATDGFSLPQEQGLSRKICGLPRFVTVRGGAYFFLPSLPALRYLAALR